MNLVALAVNEENASGGRVVTAPTNGAAGIIPAVLHYAMHYTDAGRPIPTTRRCGSCSPRARSVRCTRSGPRSPAPRSVARARSARRASMAAGGLAEILGGTPQQVENAAEIAMEHSLGLTCDPIGGLGADPVHRTQRHLRRQGDQRRPYGAARRRHPPGQPRRGDRDDARHRDGHEREVQGDLDRWAGRQRSVNVVEC